MWAEVLDQVLHFGWTLMFLLPLAHYKPSIKIFVLVAILAMLPREIVDQWSGNFGWGKATDIFFFALGGLAAGLIWKRKNTTRE